MSPAQGTTHAPVKGKKITILSVDGGGIRGLIPAVLLEYLEKELQKIDGPDARLVDYFDVVAGTSTGGLLTAMITTPKKDDPKKPLYAASELVPFYLTHCPKIFPQSSIFNPLNWLQGKFGPKYDGRYLHSLVGNVLGDSRLTGTLTNVVIPSFDIKHLQPVIFNSFDARRDPLRNPKLADVCISTSAAPTFLPAHYFAVEGQDGLKEYHMVDGGACANNPTMAAVGAVSKEITRRNKDFYPINPVDYGRFLVISLGTGSDKADGKYNARDAAQWGPLGWIYDFKSSGNPVIEVFMQGSSDMVDFHASTVFQSVNCESNYLRIQYDSLVGDETLMDKATKDNLNHLVQVGKELLKMPVSRINLETGSANAVGNGKTNAEQLAEFAKQLSRERKLRQEATV